MKTLLNLSLLITIATIAFLSPTSAAGQREKFRTTQNGVPNQYIVVLAEKYLDPIVKRPSIETSADYLAYAYGGKVRQSFSSAISGYVVEMTDRQARMLSRDDRVAFIEQDSYITAASSQDNATWGLDRIDQRNLPLNARYTWATDASNVHAYVIDSGIRTTHSEFGGRASIDFDLYSDGNQDCLGHGTHVAGTIGGATWGVAKNVRLHSVRVLGCTNSGTVSGLIAGIDWVKQNHISPAVANISITASSVSSTLNNAVRSLSQSGVTVVTSAGNYNSDACNYSPSSASNVIAVGAVGSNDAKASYSNYGSCVDVWAPGTAIYSASHGDDTSRRVMSGTSMASPHVAGVAALYLAQNPSASPSTVEQNIVSNGTAGVLTGLDTASPDRLLYSWLGGTPPVSQPARVTVHKRVIRRTESTASATFAFNATNLASSSFSLQSDNQFTDSNITNFGSSNAITVTETYTLGWQLTDISCTETSGGSPNQVNSTIDLSGRRANIIAEEGEQIECTFTSEELAPSAAMATISGRVVSNTGRGISGVVMILQDASTGEVRYATTNTFGYYSFPSSRVANFFVVTAMSPKGYRISNNVQSFTLEDNLHLPTFVAER